MLRRSGTKPRCAALGGGHGAVAHPAPAMDAGWAPSGGRGLVWLPMTRVRLCLSAGRGPGCGFRGCRRSCKCRTCRPARSRAEGIRGGDAAPPGPVRGGSGAVRKPPPLVGNGGVSKGFVVKSRGSGTKQPPTRDSNRLRGAELQHPPVIQKPLMSESFFHVDDPRNAQGCGRRGASLGGWLQRERRCLFTRNPNRAAF